MPDEIKEHRGTLRPGRVRDSIKAEPIEDLPAPPDFLNEKGREEWERQTASLKSLGLLSRADLGSVAAMCKEWQNYLLAEAACDGNSRYYSIKNPDGKVKYWGIHPAHTIAQQHLKSYITLCNEFGATPASRYRMPNAGISQPQTKTMSILDLMKGGKTKTA